MKTFKSYLNPTLAEDRNQFHIIVVTDAAATEDTEENIWTSTGLLDYWQRIEKPAYDSSKAHLHIARKKHVNTILRKISWHVNGFKNDKTAFNNNLNGVESAKNIVKAIIKLPEDKMLDILPNKNAATLLEGIDYLPAKCKIFIFTITDKPAATR
ncbi:MAG: DUF6367 family protein [Bacteroidota bacterium]